MQRNRPTVPGWPEMLVGATVCFIAIIATYVLSLRLTHGAPVLQGLANFVISGAGPGCGFLAAVLLRIRALEPFGFRRADAKWFALAAALAVLATGLAILTHKVYVPLFGIDDTQSDYVAAATAGSLTLAVTLFFGGIITPLGEEFFFRGVITNALNRYGAWVSVTLSALIFAASHGMNIVMPIAFMVGVFAAILFRRSRSIWPCVALHVIYNSIGIVILSTP